MLNNKYGKLPEYSALKVLEDSAKTLDQLHQSSAFKLLKNSPNAFDRLPKTAAEGMCEDGNRKVRELDELSSVGVLGGDSAFKAFNRFNNIKKKAREIDGLYFGGVSSVFGESKGATYKFKFSGPSAERPMPFTANLNIPVRYTNPIDETNKHLSAMKEDIKQMRQDMCDKNSNIFNIENMSGGNLNLQQGNESAVIVNITLQRNLDLVSEFLEELKQKLPSLELNLDQSAEVNADILTLAAQISSPKPKEGILREGISSLRTILEGAGGGAGAVFLLQLIGKINF